jgi:hypothetical protein
MATKCRILCITTGVAGFDVWNTRKAAEREISKLNEAFPEREFRIVQPDGQPFPIATAKAKPVEFRVMYGQFRRQLGGLGWKTLERFRTRPEAKRFMEEQFAAHNVTGMAKRDYKIEAVY